MISKGKYKAGRVLWVSYFKITDDGYGIGRDVPPTSFVLTKDCSADSLSYWQAERTLRECAKFAKKLGPSNLEVFETEEDARKSYDECIQSAIQDAKDNIQHFHELALQLEECLKQKSVTATKEVKI